MTVPARLAAFAVAVAVAFGAGAALGAAVAPIDDPAPTAPTEHHDPPRVGEGHG